MLAKRQDNIKQILCQEEAGQAAVGEEVDVAVVEAEVGEEVEEGVETTITIRGHRREGEEEEEELFQWTLRMIILQQLFQLLDSIILPCLPNSPQ